MRLLSIGVVSLVLAFGQVVRAQEGQAPPPSYGEGEPTTQEDPNAYVMEEPPSNYPVVFSERPLTLPAMTLRGDVGFQIIHVDFGFGSDTTATALGAGVGFGIIDDFEVGLGASPIAPTLPAYAAALSIRGLSGLLSPEGSRGFNQPQFYGRYRFFSSDSVEVGAELGLILPAEGGDFGLNVAVPARFRFGDSFALDAGLGFFTSFAEDAMGDADPYFGMTLNLSPRFAMEMFYAGLDTGFFLPFEDPEFTIIPLTFEAGATIGLSDTMVLDVFAHGGLPYFLIPGSDGDKAITEIWTIGFGARIYIGLAG